MNGNYMGAEEIKPAELTASISELIAIAETIPQIIAIADRIRQEQPGGKEWGDLISRARVVVDRYVDQIQADPSKLDELLREVGNLNKTALFDGTELQTSFNKLTAAAAEAKQREVAAAQELPQFIQDALTITSVVQLAISAENTEKKQEVWPQLRARALQIIEAYKTQAQANPSLVGQFKYDLLTLRGTTLFTEFERSQLLSQIR